MAKCYNLLNSAVFNALGIQIQNCSTQNELQTLVNTVFQDISTLESTMNSQLNYLAPIAALLTPPTSPTDAVTWITSYITDVLTPMYQPYITQTAQLAALAIQVSNLTTLINTVASQKNFTITIPPINPTYCTL
jgi:hypothetical protein